MPTKKDLSTSLKFFSKFLTGTHILFTWEYPLGGFSSLDNSIKVSVYLKLTIFINIIFHFLQIGLFAIFHFKKNYKEKD